MAAIKLFTDRGIRFKILSSIVMSLILAVAIGVTSLMALGRTNDAAQEMADHNLTGVQMAGTMHETVDAMRIDIFAHAFAPTAAEQQSGEAIVNEEFAAIRQQIADFQAFTKLPAALELLTSLNAGTDAYDAIWQTKIIAANENRDVEAFGQIRNNEVTPISTKMAEDLDGLRATQADASVEAAKLIEATYTQSLWTIIIVTGVGVSLALTLALMVIQSIVSGVRRVMTVATAMEQGDLRERTELTSQDEIGTMGRAIDNALVALGNVVTSVSENATVVAAAAEELSASTLQILAAAEETARQGGVAAAAAEQVSRNVDSVSAGAQQMGISIQEIASNATLAASVSADAVHKASDAGTTIRRLGLASSEIGNIVKTITSIAEQTNLLALNATIEAARAGDAGKGFAVVASEVKDLAQETARATEDIARRVEGIQTETSAAVEIVAGIEEVIATIDGYQATISAAVEEQTATTSEITRSVSEAAVGTNEIAQNITGVATASDQTSRDVTAQQAAVGELARMSESLLSLVQTFKA